jgi:two-component system cell cycle sensor histidine kinase/response regulator CckA
MELSPFAIFDHLTAAVCVLDLDYRVVFANRAMFAMFGGEEQLVGKTCHEVCHQYNCPCGQECLSPEQCVVKEALTLGQEVKGSLVYRLSDGTIRDLEVTASPVRDSAGAIVNIIHMLHDVSEGMAAKRTLARAAEIDASLAELSKSLIAGRTIEEIADLVMEQARRFTDSRYACVGTLSADGMVVLSSRTPEAWDKPNHSGQPIVLKEIGGLWGWVVTHAQSLLSNDPSSDPRSAGLPADHFPVHRFLSSPATVDGQILGQISVANAERDYTPDDQAVLERLAALFALAVEHRDHDQKILRAKQEWELTFDAIGDIVCLQDHDMRIVRVNRATAKLFGKEPEELIGKPCYTLFHDADKPCNGCPIEDVLATSCSHFAVVEHPKFDKIFEVTLSPIINDQGETTGYAHFAKDITGLKKLELQLREALKMEAVGRLAGGVAHDFNNVLTVISGYLGIALADVAEDSPLHDSLVEVDKASQRAAGLVRQLLLFSRRQPMQFLPIDFNAALNELFKMLRRFIGENVMIDMTLADDLWTLQGDTGTVDQIVMNLAVNARDAMPDGGTLTIETKNVEVDEAFCLGKLNARPGRFVRLSISDTGCGMDQETMQHIFEPFFTTKEAGKGTGLGLAVVYGIVTEHQGWISCHSQPGQGTVFQVYLPAASASVQEKAGPGGYDLQGLQGHEERVLIVEDEETILKFGEWVLSHNGYQVTVAKNVTEAMEIAGRDKAHFDMLFSDVVLPDGYGTDLATRLSAHNPGLGVILTSGYPDKQGQWPRIREQNWTFIQKPYQVSELLQVLQKELGTHCVTTQVG